MNLRSSAHSTPRLLLAASALCALILAAALDDRATAGAPSTLRQAVPVGAEQAPPASGPEVAVPDVSASEADQVLDTAEATLAGAGADADATSSLGEVAQILPALQGEQRHRGEALLSRPTDGAADPGDDGYTVPPRAIYSTNFCYFWVESGPDAVPLADTNGNTIPDYVEAIAGVAEEAYAAEHGRLGWQKAPSDGSLGCDAGDGRPRIDVYAKDLRDLYGYVAPDPDQQGARQYSYLVMENDMAELQSIYPNPLLAVQVTAAHEYNHILHFGYDALQDAWMAESTATWMEEQVYPAVNDYLQYIGVWARDVGRPMTKFSSDSLKVYGSAVWNHFLSARYGPAVIRNAWAASLKTNPQHLAVKAYERAIGAASRGRSSFLADYVRFAAATAEWHATAVFPDSSAYPDVKRSAILRARDRFFTRIGLDHTTFRLADVPDRSGSALKLRMTAPRGLGSGLALVGRIGNGGSAKVITVLRVLPNGGKGIVRLPRSGRFSRITAVLVNGDIDVGGFSARTGDWIYKGDRARFEAGVFAIR